MKSLQIASLTVLLNLTAFHDAGAAVIGTVDASPSSSLTVGDIKFTVSNFTLVTTVSGGGGITYQPADITIDFFTAGAASVGLIFSTNNTGPAPGTSFFANLNQSSNFTLTYDLLIEPAVMGSGTVAYSLFSSEMTQSHAGNGLGTVQTIVVDANNVGTSILLNSNTTTSDSASITDKLNAIEVGNLLSLNGGNVNPSNIALLNYQNEFTAVFRPIPEPSGLALLGLGLAGLRRGRKR